jgi:hypothetical protein
MCRWRADWPPISTGVTGGADGSGYRPDRGSSEAVRARSDRMAQHAPKRWRTPRVDHGRCLIMRASGALLCAPVVAPGERPREPPGAPRGRGRRVLRRGVRHQRTPCPRSADAVPASGPGGWLILIGNRIRCPLQGFVELPRSLHVMSLMSIALSAEPPCAFCRLPYGICSAGCAARGGSGHPGGRDRRGSAGEKAGQDSGGERCMVVAVDYRPPLGVEEGLVFFPAESAGSFVG